MYTHKTRNMLVVAGEASGDHHGALVVRELKSREPSLDICGIGGDELAGAGMNILFHCRDLSVLGFAEVFSRAAHILEAYLTIRKQFMEAPPDLIMLIDFPEFNLFVARLARKHRVPVLYYISPQIWAWRRGRAKKIARLVDKMAVVFPFEKTFYDRVGLDVEFVGHPLLDQTIERRPYDDALRYLGLGESRPVIGLLPGSRYKEVSSLLPVMLDAALLIKKEFPGAQFVVPVAPGIDTAYVAGMKRTGFSFVHTPPGDFNQTLAVCDLVIVASGTATLQTALMEKPMIILYTVAALTYLLGRMLIKVPHIGLANIVAGKHIVPELIQSDVTPRRIAGEAAAILKNPQRLQVMKNELAAVKHALGGRGASRRVAEIALEMMAATGGTPAAR